MKPAFVLGNGKSRLAVDLEILKQHGLVYGCNALYRDFTPHVLVATDPGISNEIEASGYAQHNTFYTRNPTTQLGSKLIEHHFGFSSGPVAAKLAAIYGHKIIYLLGFDLVGNCGMQNNVYSDTSNYKPKDYKETYYGNWIDQISTVMSEHQSQTFVRVIHQDGIIPFRWTQISNYLTQNIEQFRLDINKKPWQKPKELATDTQLAPHPL